MARFQKGQPSPNPAGRGFSRDVIEKAAKSAPGSTGVIAYSGFVNIAEPNTALVGRQKWVTYANAPIRSAPVAISMLLRQALLGGVKWSLVENPAGGKAAKKGLDVCQRGLLDARLPTPWRAIVPKASNGSYFGGFSLHATAMARRPDGLVTYTDIAHRPQHTIYQWLRADPRSPFTDVVQRIEDGNTYPIKLSDCFYLRNSTLSDGPEGQGVLRMIVERIQETRNYRNLEGSEFFSSMAGTPIARAPLEEIAAAAAGKTAADLQAYIDAATQKIEDAVKNRIKDPSKRLYLKLDSKTYQGSNPNTISTVQKWGIEILRTDAQGLAEIRKVITDNDLDDARILGVEFVFVGGGDTRGTFGMHESKVSLLSAQLAGDLDMVGDQGTQQLCRPLVAANGLDPDDACPTLSASPISTEDVEKTARSLGLLNMSGLAPNHPAKIAMFDRMNLPWQDEPDFGAPRMLPPAMQRLEDRTTPVLEPEPKPSSTPVIDPTAPKPGSIATRTEPAKPDVKP